MPRDASLPRSTSECSCRAHVQLPHPAWSRRWPSRERAIAWSFILHFPTFPLHEQPEEGLGPRARLAARERSGPIESMSYRSILLDIQQRQEDAKAARLAAYMDAIRNVQLDGSAWQRFYSAQPSAAPPVVKRIRHDSEEAGLDFRLRMSRSSPTLSSRRGAAGHADAELQQLSELSLFEPFAPAGSSQPVVGTRATLVRASALPVLIPQIRCARAHDPHALGTRPHEGPSSGGRGPVSAVTRVRRAHTFSRRPARTPRRDPVPISEPMTITPEPTPRRAPPALGIKTLRLSVAEAAKQEIVAFEQRLDRTRRDRR